VEAAPHALLAALDRLIEYYDIDRWHWRNDTPALDICLGAILVQHTAWSNVEKALANLRAAGCSSIHALLALPLEDLALLVRPAGTPRTKALRLHAFASLVQSHAGFDGLFSLPANELRLLLLATPGIGPETADVILLYAARLPVVVHDAYTARLCRRLGLGPHGDRYDAWRAWLDSTLPFDLDYRRAAHAAIVVHCKQTCRVRPLCPACPLLEICQYGWARIQEG
jgi:endonuclease-3 related protein